LPMRSLIETAGLGWVGTLMPQAPMPVIGFLHLSSREAARECLAAWLSFARPKAQGRHTDASS
jgi:hypothetical protein